MDEKLNQIRHDLLETFKKYPYFFDAKIKENQTGITILVSKYANKPYVKRVANKHKAGKDVSLEYVNDMGEYFHWFSDAVDSNLTDNFVAAQEKTLEALANKFGSESKIQKGVTLMEKGKHLTTIDFVYKQGTVLYLFKVGSSDKKHKRKLASIQAGADFFRKHFWDEYSVVKGNVAYSDGIVVNFEGVHDARHSGPLKGFVKKIKKRR